MYLIVCKNVRNDFRVPCVFDTYNVNTSNNKKTEDVFGSDKKIKIIIIIVKKRT